MTARGGAAAPRHRHPDAAARRTPRCSPARPSSSTTSSSPARCTCASCAARTRTPASRSIDARPPLGMPGVVAVLTGADLARRVGRPDAVRVAGHRRHEEPRALPDRDRQGLLRRRRRGGRGRHDRVPSAETRPTRWSSTTSRCRRWSTSRTRSADRVRHPRGLGTNTCYTWELDARRRRGRRRVRAAAHTVERALRAAAAHPDGDGAACGRRGAAAVRRRRHACTRRRRSPTSSRSCCALTLGIPEQQDAGRRARGRRRLRLEARTSTPRSCCALALARKLRRPVRWTEERSEDAQATIQGRGQIQDIELAADADGKVTAVRVRAARRHGRVPAARHARHPAARRVPLPRRLRHPDLLVRVHVGVHQQDADRRVPRRGPARGDVRDRARDGRAGRRGRHRSGRDPAAQLHPARRSSRTPRRPAWCFDSRRLRAGARPGARARRLRRRCAPSRPTAVRPASTKHLGVGISSYVEMCGLAPSRGARVAELRRPAAGRRRPCACCPPARCRWSPARRRTARATRRRGR